MSRRRPTDGYASIYCITNTVNGHRYIGQTIFTVPTRWNMHKCEMRRGSKYPLHLAMQKYGVESFRVEKVLSIAFAIIESDKDMLDRLEVFFIKEFGTWTRWGNGYNATLGGRSTGRGENSPNFGRKHTEEFKANAAERMRGKKNPNFGKPASGNVREAVSKRHKGVRLSNEHRAKISAAHLSENPSPKALAKRQWKRRVLARGSNEMLVCTCGKRSRLWVIGRDFIMCKNCNLLVGACVAAEPHEKLSWATARAVTDNIIFGLFCLGVVMLIYGYIKTGRL